MKLYLETCSQQEDLRIEGAWHKSVRLDGVVVFSMWVRGLAHSNHIEFVLSEQEAEALKAALLMRPE